MKILVIDDHPLIHEALSHVLFELDASLELIQAHDSNDTHAALARAPDTDLIVLDLALPGTDGFELLSDLRREWPGIPVVVLSATHDRTTVEAALDMGAMGFVPKTANARVLIDALRLLLGPVQYRQKNGNENRDDRHHHQQLNQCKSSLGAHARLA